MFKRQEFLDEVESAWTDFQAALAAVKLEDMERAGFQGQWSLKDVLAHITWFEKEMLGVLSNRALVGSTWWNLPQDERNRLIFGQNQARLLPEVRAEFDAVHAKLWVMLQDITDEELNDHSRFKEMPPEWIPGDVLSSNTYEHYQTHATAIHTWLGREKPEKSHTQQVV
jgi:hypothetical protein